MEESVEVGVWLSKVPSVKTTSSSLEKSKRSSTMKWSAVAEGGRTVVLFASEDWRFSLAN